MTTFLGDNKRVARSPTLQEIASDQRLKSNLVRLPTSSYDDLICSIIFGRLTT